MMIREIEIDGHNKLRIGVSQFKGNYRLDIRHLFNADEVNPNWTFTKKGINIDVALARGLQSALDAVMTEFLAGSSKAAIGGRD